MPLLLRRPLLLLVIMSMFSSLVALGMHIPVAEAKVPGCTAYHYSDNPANLDSGAPCYTGDKQGPYSTALYECVAGHPYPFAGYTYIKEWPSLRTCMDFAMAGGGSQDSSALQPLAVRGRYRVDLYIHYSWDTTFWYQVGLVAQLWTTFLHDLGITAVHYFGEYLCIVAGSKIADEFGAAVFGMGCGQALGNVYTQFDLN